MPLQGSNMQRFVQNRESGGPQPEPGKRSVTPQHRHERSRQRSNDAVERKTHGPSPDGNGRDEVMRRDASRLKLPVPNTLARSKSNSTKPADKSGAGGAAPIAQNNGSRTVPNMQLPRQVSIFRRHNLTAADASSLSFQRLTIRKASISMTAPALQTIKTRPRNSASICMTPVFPLVHGTNHLPRSPRACTQGP